MDVDQRTPGLASRASLSRREVAETVALAAGRYILARRADLGDQALRGSVSTKSSAVDPVTAVDKESEALIRRLLSALAPGDRILGEEEGTGQADGSGASAHGGAATWIVDPIDGTVNFLYGIPCFAVSVACADGDDVVAGAVVNVATGELYSAALGEGARLTDRDGRSRDLRCSEETSMGKALVATGFSYSAELRQRQGAVVAALLPQCRDIRRMGSAALDLCAVADGRADAYYEHGIKVWDYAAGALIAAEAGATVVTPALAGALTVAGAPEGDPLRSGVYVCAPTLADEFIATTQELVGRQQ
nr:inositol monophosphatase family protein [Corynebacterium lactis]